MHADAALSSPADLDGASPTAEVGEVVAQDPTFPGAPAELPYGPLVQRLLPSLDRAFRIANRWYVLPAIKAGLGPLHANPLTGSWMLLRTTGRTSGQTREVALGYAIVDGSVYCCAGFGPRTNWFRNIEADPRVEVVLPGGAIAGTASEVTDPDELLRAWRALLRAYGLLGRVLVGPASAPPEVLAAGTRNLPVVRIRPTGIGSGPADPGGWLWLSLTALTAWWIVKRGRKLIAALTTSGSRATR